MNDQDYEVGQVFYSAGWVGQVDDVGYVVGGQPLPPTVQRSMRVSDVETAREVEDENDKIESAVEARVMRARLSGQVKHGIDEVFAAAERQATRSDRREASIARSTVVPVDSYGELTAEQKVGDLMHGSRMRAIAGTSMPRYVPDWGPMHAGTALRAASRRQGR